MDAPTEPFKHTDASSCTRRWNIASACACISVARHSWLSINFSLLTAR